MDNILFEPENKSNFEELLSSGLVDTFRSLYPKKAGAYTWWGPKNKNRIENRGSRLDYFLVSEELLPSVHNIKFHTDIQGSDHCPISMMISPAVPKRELDRGDLAVLWRSINWPTMREELFSRQREIALSAFYQQWEKVETLQNELLGSWVARALAVQAVVDSNSEVGVDGVRWTTDAQKAQAALFLKTKGYRPLPYRHTEIVENGKTRIIHVPTSRDKAMLTLCAFALDPVAESTADHRSFFARKGRSLMDLHAYLHQELSGRNAPEWVVVIDVQSFYGSITHEWLLEHTPMDKDILYSLLKAGVVMKGDLFPTEQGISLGTSLSPILGNMILDGLQSRIFDRLFPNGRFDYSDGKMFRFADDILILARSEEHAKFIMQVVEEFLAERGLRINHEKSYITNVYCGFDFLSRHSQRKSDVLHATPADKAIIKAERELETLIMNFKGTQRALISKINQKLSGLATYHRVTDAYMDFRHIDAVVEGLLIEFMCRKKYKHWKRKTVLNKFWIKEGECYVFVLPNDPSCRVKRIAPLEIVKHKPCKLSFNPYLDWKYYNWLQERRDVQKANGKYYAVWTRQSGKCAYCGQAMLPDQEVEIVERVIGEGRHVRNLQYIHRQCAYDSFFNSDELGEHINLFSMLDGINSKAPVENTPYMELTEYFRLCKKAAFSLTFK